MTIHDILSRLDGVKGRDGQWSARCPAHADKERSLSIDINMSLNRIALKCSAGCPTLKIVQAMDLTLKDLEIDGSMDDEDLDLLDYEEDSDDEDDGLPPVICEPLGCGPDDLNDELIAGVLRQGHKMLLAGPSKAGKSYALIELAVCIAEGLEWLGFRCAQGPVMYVNLELDRASCLHRFHDVRQAMGAPSRHSVDILNLRGKSMPMNFLSKSIIAKFRNRGYIAVIVDPIYKVLTGNENKAYDMTQFCIYFEEVAESLNCAVIYAHHHSKGDQSWKRAMDRASGSGVFARDADALLDVIELELPPDRRREGASAWRITGTLREFRDFPPVDVWFNWPLHVVEHFGPKEVAPHHELPPWRRAMNGRKSKEQKLKERKHRIGAAVDILRADGVTPTIKALADYLGVSADTVRRSVDEHDGLVRENGIVQRA